jgi:invasion protein IalB
MPGQCWHDAKTVSGLPERSHLFPTPNSRMHCVRLRAFICFFAAFVMGVNFGLSPASAQGTVKDTFGEWQMRCETPPGAKSEQCALVQNVAAEDKPNVTLLVIILKTADAKSRLLRVVAPLGVLLPAGLGLKIDQVDVGRAGFVRCLTTGCVAEVVMDDTLVGQMKSGQTATFIVFQTPEEGVGIPVSLVGFSKGFDTLP